MESVDEDTSVSDAFVISMRLECLQLAASNKNLNSSIEIVNAAKSYFKFLTDDIEEDNETAERSN